MKAAMDFCSCVTWSCCVFEVQTTIHSFTTLTTPPSRHTHPRHCHRLFGHFCFTLSISLTANSMNFCPPHISSAQSLAQSLSSHFKNIVAYILYLDRTLSISIPRISLLKSETLSDESVASCNVRTCMTVGRACISRAF